MQNMIKNFVKNMKKEDLENFVKSKNINATSQEIDVVYDHMKTYFNDFFNDPIYYIKLLKGKISDDNYYRILMAFDQYKQFL